MKRAAKDMRSGDERNARDSVVWLTGYLKAMDDLEDSAAHDNPRRPECHSSGEQRIMKTLPA